MYKYKNIELVKPSGLELKDRQEMVKIINRLAYYKTIIIACSESPEGLLVHKKIDLG